MEALSAIQPLANKGSTAASNSGGKNTSRAREAPPEKTKESVPESSSQFQDIEEQVREKIKGIAKDMDEYVRSSERSLKIQVHSGTGNIMVKVISKEDGRTIREIPPEQVLNLAAKMEEMMGLLFDKKV